MVTNKYEYKVCDQWDYQYINDNFELIENEQSTKDNQYIEGFRNGPHPMKRSFVEHFYQETQDEFVQFNNAVNSVICELQGCDPETVLEDAVKLATMLVTGKPDPEKEKPSLVQRFKDAVKSAFRKISKWFKSIFGKLKQVKFKGVKINWNAVGQGVATIAMATPKRGLLAGDDNISTTIIPVVGSHTNVFLVIHKYE